MQLKMFLFVDDVIFYLFRIHQINLYNKKFPFFFFPLSLSPFS